MKRSWLSWFAILAMMMMVFAAAGCSDDDDDNNGGGGTPFDVTAAITAAGDDYFDDYMIEFPVGSGTMHGVNVTASAVFANLAADIDHYYVVDMRSADDFAWCHIQGAVNLSMGGLVAAIETMPTDKIILVTCYSGQTASYATSIINLLGTETGHRAQNLKFGASGILEPALIKDGGWTYGTDNAQAALMVQTPSPAKNPAGPYPTLDDDVDNAVAALTARAAVAADAWVNGTCRASNGDVEAPAADLYLINFFSEAAYADGHLGHAIQYSTPDAFTTGQFLNTLPLDKQVAVYCYTGQTSAQVAAFLQMMGYTQGKTVTYGVQKMCYDNEDINDVPWHGPEDDYTSIFEGPGLSE